MQEFSPSPSPCNSYIKSPLLMSLELQTQPLGATMAENTTKIRLKVGQLEVEYEGNEAFLEGGIYEMMEKIASLHAKHSAILSSSSPQVKTQNDKVATNVTPFDLAVNAIAERLDATTGAHLALAAATYLTLAKNEPKFSRAQILEAMKSDASRYKRSMSKNLTRHLQSLIKDKCLNNVADGRYALSAPKRKEIESALKDT